VLVHILLHSPVTEVGDFGKPKALRIELWLVLKFLTAIVPVHLFQFVFMLGVFFCISIHNLCSRHIAICEGLLVHITTSWIYFWREKRSYLFFNSLNIFLFTILENIVLPIKTEINKLFIDQKDLSVSKTKSLSIDQTLEDLQLVNYQCFSILPVFMLNCIKVVL
jgi:hypothetical protein